MYAVCTEDEVPSYNVAIFQSDGGAVRIDVDNFVRSMELSRSARPWSLSSSLQTLMEMGSVYEQPALKRLVCASMKGILKGRKYTCRQKPAVFSISRLKISGPFGGKTRIYSYEYVPYQPGHAIRTFLDSTAPRVVASIPSFNRAAFALGVKWMAAPISLANRERSKSCFLSLRLSRDVEEWAYLDTMSLLPQSNRR